MERSTIQSGGDGTGQSRSWATYRIVHDSAPDVSYRFVALCLRDGYWHITSLPCDRHLAVAGSGTAHQEQDR